MFVKVNNESIIFVGWGGKKCVGPELVRREQEEAEEEEGLVAGWPTTEFPTEFVGFICFFFLFFFLYFGQNSAELRVLTLIFVVNLKFKWIKVELVWVEMNFSLGSSYY